MNQYIIAPEAIKDLDAISDYFAERNVAAGEKLLDEFQKKCRYLVQFTQIWRSYKEICSYLRGLLASCIVILSSIVSVKIP